MSKPFRYTLDRRITNRILVWLLRIGKAPHIYYLLTVTGRKSGNPHSVPVVLIEDGGKRWLTAPYGEVDWVKNARASGIVTISRQKWKQDFTIHQLSPEQAAPLLKEYLQKFPITKPYFDAKEDSPISEFIKEAQTKPVFELIKIEDIPVK